MQTLITFAAALAMVLTVGCGKDKTKSTELSQGQRDKMVGLYQATGDNKKAGLKYVIISTDNKLYYVFDKEGQLEIRIGERDLKRNRFTFDGSQLESGSVKYRRIGGPSEAASKGLKSGMMSYVKMADLMLQLNIRLRAAGLRVMTIWDQVKVEKYPITEVQLNLLKGLIENVDTLIAYLKDKNLEGVVFGNFINDEVFKDDDMIWFGTGIDMTIEELVEKLKEKTLL